ncbi:MAG: non-heme iron oxygenase ferredoxin subunit [Thermoprotei archaeon]
MLVKVCPVSQIAEDSINHFTLDGKEIIVTCSSGEYYAFDGVCTHEYAELWKGFLSSGIITCPLHLSQFDVKTGAVLSPPAEEPLRTYRCQILDGYLYLEV